MMQKIFFLGMMILVMTAVIFAGGSRQGGATPPGAGPITISFINGFTGGDGGFMRKITDGFNASQSKYRIDELQETDHLTKYKTGDYDLVLVVADQMATMVEDGNIQEVDSIYNAAGISINDFHPAAKQIVTINGKLYGFPLDIHPMTMFYNKGLTDTAPKTLAEVIALHQKVHSSNPNIYAMAVPGAGLGEWYMMSLAAQNGVNLTNGRHLVFDTDEFAETLLLLNSLIYKHRVSPPNLGLDGEFKAFMQDVEGAASLQAVIALTGPWFYTAAKEKYGDRLGLAPIPALGRNNGVWGGSHNISVNVTLKDQAKVDGIVEFLKYLYTPENLAVWAESGQALTHLKTMDYVRARADKYPLAAANFAQFDRIKMLPLYNFRSQIQYLNDNIYSLVVTTENLTKDKLRPELERATEFARQAAAE
jgi:multiple sugar transport system substrate-binding protein